MENFKLWLEANSGVRWEDTEENQIAGPDENEDCVAILSDGSRVLFETGYGGTKIAYPRKADKSELEQVIRQYADANPDSVLDGVDLDTFLPNYRPKLNRNRAVIGYERFEPQAGDIVSGGETHMPEKEPNLADYMARWGHRYSGGDTRHIGISTGYVLPDGRTVQMGRGPVRDDDHRVIVPSPDLRRKWGWPESDSQTQNMYELMRRSGAVRVHVNSSELMINPPGAMTSQQKAVIREAIKQLKIRTIVLAYVGGKEFEFGVDDWKMMSRHLGA